MRMTDRVLALVIGLAVFALAVLTLIEIINSALGNSGHLLLPYESVARYLREHTWNEVLAIVVGGLLALVGVVLLLAEIKRRRPDLVVLRETRDDVTAAMSTRSLRRVLINATTSVSGVASASARVRRGKVGVTARTVRGDVDEIQARSATAAQAALDGLDLAQPPSLQVSVSATGRNS